MGDQWPPITMALSYQPFFLDPPHPSRYSQSSFRSLSQPFLPPSSSLSFSLPPASSLSHSPYSSLFLIIMCHFHLILWYSHVVPTRIRPDTPSFLSDHSPNPSLLSLISPFLIRMCHFHLIPYPSRYSQLSFRTLSLSLPAFLFLSHFIPFQW